MSPLNRLPYRYYMVLAVLTLGIKYWYSQASLQEMQWMMHPLAVILEHLLPGNFEQKANGEWFNAEWQILLVKGCSGINFFIMSVRYMWRGTRL